jgi:hypothetical protein
MEASQMPTEPADEVACYLELVRWLHPAGLACPRCGRGDRLTERDADRGPIRDYRCGHCRRAFNAFTGTVLHGTRGRPCELLRGLKALAARAPSAAEAPTAGEPRSAPSRRGPSLRLRIAPKTLRDLLHRAAEPARRAESLGRKGGPVGRRRPRKRVVAPRPRNRAEGRAQAPDVPPPVVPIPGPGRPLNRRSWPGDPGGPMSYFTTLKEFRRQVDTADYEEHAETLEKAVARLATAIAAGVAAGAAGGAGIGGLAALAATSASTVAAREFERMKEFLVKLYDGTTSRHSFLDPGGHMFDCIPFEELPTVRAANQANIPVSRQAPPHPKLNHPREADLNSWTAAPRPSAIVGPLRQGLVDQFGNRIASPPGEPAFRRITLAGLARHGTLDRFFFKMPTPIFSHLPSLPPAGPGAAAPNAPGSPATTPFSPAAADPNNTHRYAVGQYGPFQSPGTAATVRGAISGLESFLNVWKTDPSPGGMTLSQQWLLCDVPGFGRQTIESGWQIIRGQFVDPTLFVYFNPDNYGGRAGYTMNQYREGFIPYKDASWHVGGSFGQASVASGNQVAALMVWHRVPSPDDPGVGDWWLYMGYSDHDLSAVGHFPGQWYARDLSPGASIASGADYCQFGGEVAPLAAQPPDLPSTATGPMGSGVLPLNESISSYYRRAAFQSALGVVSTTGSGGMVSVPVGDLRINPTNYDPTVYDIKYGTDPSWGTYFFFGGPGAP